MNAPQVHGTYNTGCRCEDCRAYQRARVARNRAERLAAGRLNHGTRSAYDAGCRCRECVARRRVATQAEAGFQQEPLADYEPPELHSLNPAALPDADVGEIPPHPSG